MSQRKLFVLACVAFSALPLLSSCSQGGDGAEGLAVSGQGVCSSQKTCPVAEAGPDQTVAVGKLVTLDGSQSNANTAGLLTYEWTVKAKPKTSVVTLAGATTVKPTFTPDVAGDYTFRLTVNDGGLPSNTDTVRVTAAAGDLAPIADAGPDQTVPPGTVNLNGNGSHDPDGQPITTYSWTLTHLPGKSGAVLFNANTVTPSFTADVPGTYKLSLIVSDATLTSAADQVVVTVVTGNIAPVANAGPDQTVRTGQVVTLNGSGSFDPNPGDTLAYSWRFQSMPAGSTATLTNPTTVNPTFTPDLDGFYVLSLQVFDSLEASSPLDMVVVKSNPTPIVFSGSGANAAAIQSIVNAFRAALGSVDNGNAAGPFETGRREINWDGGGATNGTAAVTPFTVFQNTRGSTFTTPGIGLTQTPITGGTVDIVPGGGVQGSLADINPTYATSFITFSPLRLFTPLGSNITVGTFSIPGTGGGTPATIAGFGAVFTDVDLANTTSIEYFGVDGGSLGKFFAPTANNGLSFLGVQLTGDERISRIEITTGNSVLGPNDGGSVDVVVMDDFIYAEPQ